VSDTDAKQDPASEVVIECIRARDDVRLALHRIPHPGAPRVLLVPGTFSNHTYWLGTRGTGFARFLATAGFEPWALDPRGHGASQRAERRDRWDFDDWARIDIPAAMRAARGTFVVGHSAGGAALLAALAAEPELREGVRGIVVAGTPVPWLQPWRGIVARGIRALSAVLGRFPARRLGLGPEDELPGVMRQWMGWNLAGHWRGDDGVDYFARLAELHAPVLAIAGAGDHTFAPPAACRALLDMIGADDRTFMVAGRAAGFSADYGHAGLLASREARAELWGRVVEWMGQRSGRGPGSEMGSGVG
jgi:predicted alpha/beta hydrolase